MEDSLEYQWQLIQDLEDISQSDMQVKVTLTATVSYNGQKPLSKQALTKLEQRSDLRTAHSQRVWEGRVGVAVRVCSAVEPESYILRCGGLLLE